MNFESCSLDGLIGHLIGHLIGRLTWRKLGMHLITCISWQFFLTWVKKRIFTLTSNKCTIWTLKSDFALFNRCLLEKDKAVSFYMLYSVIVAFLSRLVAAGVVVILPKTWSFGTKSNSWIVGAAIVVITSQETNSCDCGIVFTIKGLYIKPFHVAPLLEWWISQERFPLASANIRCIVSVGWHKRV